jgi:hypothetical protein
MACEEGFDDDFLLTFRGNRFFFLLGMGTVEEESAIAASIKSFSSQDNLFFELLIAMLSTQELFEGSCSLLRSSILGRFRVINGSSSDGESPFVPTGTLSMKIPETGGRNLSHVAPKRGGFGNGIPTGKLSTLLT